MKKDCWAIKSRYGFVNQTLDASQPIRTALFKTRLHALAWLEDNQYSVRQKAYPVKIKITITEV